MTATPFTPQAPPASANQRAALTDALRRLEACGRARGWAGTDPYDGLNATRLVAPLEKSVLGRRILTQPVKRSPADGIPSRRYFGSRRRLASLLEKDGLRVGILDHVNPARDPRIITSLNCNPSDIGCQLRRVRAPVIHYHHARLSTLLAAALPHRTNRDTWMVTCQSHEIEHSLTCRAPAVAALARWAASWFDQIVVVSDALVDIVRAETGFEVGIIPAYLRLSERGKTDLEVDLVKPTVVVAAYRVASRSSKDLYGLDIASAVFAAASAEPADLRFEIFLAQAPSGTGARRYLTQVLDPLRSAGLEPRVRVTIGSELSSAFRRGVVYIRTTRTDGDAVSIRQALDAGVPVLASDVAKRPAGTIRLPPEDARARVTALSAAVERSRSLPIKLRESAGRAGAPTLLYRDEIARWSEATSVAPEFRRASPAT